VTLCVMRNKEESRGLLTATGDYMRSRNWIGLSAAIVVIYVGGKMLLMQSASLASPTMDLRHPLAAVQHWRWSVTTVSLRDDSGVLHGAALSLCQIPGTRDGQRAIKVGNGEIHYSSSLYIRFAPPFRTSSGVRQIYEVLQGTHRRVLLTTSPTRLPWRDPKIVTLTAPRCAATGSTIVVVNARTGHDVLHGTLLPYKLVPEFHPDGSLNTPSWPSGLPPDPNL